MVDEGMVLTGRGRIPKEPDPLLSVDAIEGCRIRPTTGADMVLSHGAERLPTVTVCPLELLWELGGLRTSGDSILCCVGLAFAAFSLTGVGESGGDAKGAIALGTRSVRWVSMC